MAAGLTVTMTVWDNDTTDEGKTWMDGLIAQFEAAHAGVAVEVQRVHATGHPDRFVLRPDPTIRLDRHGKLRIELSPLSWT